MKKLSKNQMNKIVGALEKVFCDVGRNMFCELGAHVKSLSYLNGRLIQTIFPGMAIGASPD